MQSRTRTKNQDPSYGGKPCPKLIKYEACNMDACPIDCSMTNWRNEAWISGDKTTSDTYNYWGRQAMTNRDPNKPQLQIDFHTYNWYGGRRTRVGTTCTKTCGGGTLIQSRAINVDSAFGGKTCAELYGVDGNLTQVIDCNTQDCPTDCVVNEWTVSASTNSRGWEACSKPCGQGKQTRSRTIKVYASHGGVDCPTLNQTRFCNFNMCPIDCKATSWSEWSYNNVDGQCSKTCGSGYQLRTRSVTRERYGGAPCVDGSGSQQTQACATTPCPVDCVVSDWGTPASCSRSCGVGNTFKTRSIKTAPAYGGKRCPSTIINSDCNIGFCPQDCVYGYYREWSTCSVSCGSVGVMTRRRSITTMDANNGVPCNETLLEQQKACNLGPCPTRCKLSDWGDWGSCQKQVGSSFQQVSCGGGNKTRTRFVLNPGTDGQTCPERSETVPCNEHPCPIDCELNDWTVSADTDSNGWTECTKTCGGGSQSRTRTVKIQRQYGGEECGDPVEQRSCSRTPCAVDCVVSDPNWNETANEWSECSVSCGGGLKFKHRSIMRSPAYNGTSCPALRKSAVCEDSPCPEDCTVTDWNGWSQCTKSCGGGTQTKRRYITNAGSLGGKDCPELSEWRTCGQQSCSKISDHFYNMDTCAHVSCSALACNNWNNDDLSAQKDECMDGNWEEKTCDATCAAKYVDASKSNATNQRMRAKHLDQLYYTNKLTNETVWKKPMVDCATAGSVKQSEKLVTDKKRCMDTDDETRHEGQRGLIVKDDDFSKDQWGHTIRVFHHNNETQGTSHICRWEYGAVNDCVCKCFHPSDWTDSAIIEGNKASQARVSKTASQYPITL
jgi:hypothetical protein